MILEIIKKRWWLGLLFLSIISCKKENITPNSPKGRQLLVYMIADNNLNYFAINDINEMERGMVKSDTSTSEVLVFIDRGINGKPSHPYLMKIVPDTSKAIKSEILKVYPEINSANAQTLNEVLSDMNKLSDSQYKSKGLVLWSHGNAWLPPEVSLTSELMKTKYPLTIIIAFISLWSCSNDSPNITPKEEKSESVVWKKIKLKTKALNKKRLYYPLF